MVLDVLMSLHLIAEERGLTAKSPFTGRLIFWLEKIGLRLPDLLIADTPEYVQYYCQNYGLSPARFQRVELGVDDRVFSPRPRLQPPSDSFRVLYYGTFIPLHGVETVIRAAAELRDRPDIRIDLYGDGQERPPAEALAARLGLENVRFLGWIREALLPDEIARAHLCLGVFGTTKQAVCTIQNKIWEGMIMRRPVITGDSATVRQELIHRRHVYLVERADPQALAAGIRELADDAGLREQLAQNGYRRAQANTIEGTGRSTMRALAAGLGLPG
jgi:glycosyltransferase involved in cell wall biosynthesis